MIAATERLITLHGRFQQAVDARNGGFGPRERVVALPAWVWRAPTVEQGRKSGMRQNGKLQPAPFWLTWADVDGHTSHTFALGRGQKITLSWTVKGPGLFESGTVTLASGFDGVTVVDGVLPDGLAADMIDVTPASHLECEGVQARWGLVTLIGGWAEKTLRQEHVRVTRELAGEAYGSHLIILDPIQLDQALSIVTIGDGERGGHVARLVDRMVATDVYHRVDPERYVRTSLRRDCEAVIRQMIGDLAVGPKIRRLWRKKKYDSVEALVADYRALYPADRLGVDRARKCIEAAGAVRRVDRHSFDHSRSFSLAVIA